MHAIEAKCVVATLQKALDLAHQRIREHEQNAAVMNQRFAEVQAQRDNYAAHLLDRDAEARQRD